ncbi:MAG: TolC family outer membrane protein [Campylobacterota bacterium]|nr:TolC family outer membrane protein [Campylobacterota bacterium]
MKSFLLMLITPALFALTLPEMVQNTLDSNPNMQREISNYKAVRYDLDRADAGYKPTLDLTGGIGMEHTEKDYDGAQPDVDEDLTRKEARIVGTENLFQGFQTKYDVIEQEGRIDASRYTSIQEANTLALRASEVYIAVLKQKALLNLQDENVKTHERIYKMIREKNAAGLGRRSDMEQTEGRLALAYVNYISQQNNYQDAMINFERIYGEMRSASLLEEPNAPALPANTLEALENLAEIYNPTMAIERANIQSRQATMEKSRSTYYPKIDAELSADWSDDVDGVKSTDQGYRAMLRLYYNLYNGGSDEALRLQNLQYITSQKESLNEQQRAVLEKLKLAWMAHQILMRQIRCLNLHANLSKQTSSSYAQEYQLGRRSLLDLLNVELEFNNARQQVATAEKDLLFTRYRILEAVGLLHYALQTNVAEKVEAPLGEELAFNVLEIEDLALYGELDEFIDINSVCSVAHPEIEHTLYVAEEEPEKEETLVVEETSTGAKLTIEHAHFAFGSAELSEATKKHIAVVAKMAEESPDKVLEVHAYTDSIGSELYNQYLSEKRAENAQKALIENGISQERIVIYGKGETNPIADNMNRDGRAKNRRIEFYLEYPKN